MKWVSYAVGYVFITSGILKFIVSDFRSAFIGLGFPFPEATLFLVALLEVACGMMIAGRIYVKKAVIPLFIIMVGAILFTKIPILQSAGVLQFAFEARLDIVMLILLGVLWKGM
jgi:uncharacterized membrane protein YphA (DoxX/SURF4 family)